MKTLDIVILLIALTICFDITLSIWKSTMGGGDYDAEKMSLVSDIMSQLVAVIILYVGNKLRY